MILALFVSLFTVIPVFSQKEKIHTVKSVRGEFGVVLTYSDVTGREAMEKARDDARQKAIEQVCGSRINIWDQVELSAAGETFSSTAINQIDGEIVDFAIVDEGYRQSDVRAAETVFYCVADVKVKRGVDPDPDFVAAIEGLRSLYFTGEHIEFTVTPSKGCYMKVFLFEDFRKGYLLYPNDYDLSTLLQQNTSNAFPRKVDFEIEKSSPQQTETNRLVFVFTKSERPFLHAATTRQEIEKWIAMIPNDEKFIFFATIDIRDN